MTTQRDDMAGPDAADPAPGQADPSEPITGQIVPPPRVDSEPGQPTDAASPDDPAADPDRVVLDDPVQAGEPADDLGPAENGESAVDSETVTDREPEDAPPLMTDGGPEDDAPLATDHEAADAPPLATDEEPDGVVVVEEVLVAGEAPATGDVAAPGPVPPAAPVADAPDTTPAAALAEQQWPAIQSMFVDDPRGAVERAAAAAGEVAAALIATLEREQDQLRSSWQQGSDTEQLRTALQRYRAFCGRLEGLS
jgi:hypothetical protein